MNIERDCVMNQIGKKPIKSKTVAEQSSTGPFSEENIARAVDRVPGQPSATLRDIRIRAMNHDRPETVAALIAAIDAELDGRPVDVDGPAAERNAVWAREADGLTLTDAVRYAFGTAREASDEERRMLPILAATPGIAYQAWASAYGKRDLSLVMGHLVHDRYGCFRHLRQEGEDQSEVLIRKETVKGRKHYWLRPEAEAVFRELGLV
jgi:hypothetical protein